MTDTATFITPSQTSRIDAVQDPGLALRRPDRTDAPAIHRLISECPPLDQNSLYTYLLLSEHFSATCVVAESGEDIKGFVSSYRPPARSDVLFVWQVAVHSSARGQGLAGRMLKALLQRPNLCAIQTIETTVSPDNQASRSVFHSLAHDLQAPVEETPLFNQDLFGSEAHDDEPLLRIGPFHTL